MFRVDQMIAMVQDVAAASGTDSLEGSFLEYGAIGLLALIAVLAFWRSDTRLQTITDKFLTQMNALHDQSNQQISIAADAALKTAEANLTVALNLKKLEDSMAQHEHEAGQRYREERADAAARHKEILDRLIDNKDLLNRLDAPRNPR